uniref:Ionotropic glutamate receptor C-terminal domain-containing protein n=1 Tax=Anopheles epiroticus TaxID=199890 RepID=A0A182PAC7_9DIPT
MVLYRGLTPEQRNDFFGQVDLSVMVYTSGARHINATYVAQTVPLFRNASNRVGRYRIGQGRKKVDLHMQLITTNHFNKRLQGWFAYSLPLFHEHLSMYIHLSGQSYHERSWDILIFVLLPLLSLNLLLILFLWLSFKVGSLRRESHPNCRTISLIDAVIWMIGVTSQQGSIIRPVSWSSRIVVLVALYLSLILYCTYLTMIASQLSVDVDVDLDLRKLLLDNQYQIGFVGNITKEPIVQKRYDPVMNEIMQRMQRNISLYSHSYDHGLQRVLTTKYALIGNSGSVRNSLKHLNQEDNCNITEIELKGIEQMVTLQMPSFYAYRKMINYE